MFQGAKVQIVNEIMQKPLLNLSRFNIFNRTGLEVRGDSSNRFQQVGTQAAGTLHRLLQFPIPDFRFVAG